MDNNLTMFVRLYHWYRSAKVRAVRVVVISLLLFMVLYEVSYQMPSPLSHFLLNIFIMFEIFFHYKISRHMPSVVVDKNDEKDFYQSFTMQALYGFVNYSKTTMILKSLLKHPQVKNFLYKTNILQKDLQIEEVDKAELAKRAFYTARSLGGKFVTTVDVFIAYLFFTEEKTKLLFNKQLKDEDILEIALWIRREFSQEESPKKFLPRFYGGGIGEGLVSGWTYETNKYSQNFSYYALREEPFIIGREKEFRMMLEGLVKVENNNTLLVGDIGAGKENLVRALCYYSFSGDLGGSLNYRRVYELLVGPLTAGVENRGDLESRLQSIVAELSHAEVILYIPEFQNIVGGTSYNLDLSGALLPYLKAGNMPVVATMSKGAFKTYMEHNPLKEAFNIVMLPEPEKRLATHMVLSQAKHIEKKYFVILSYRAIESAVELAGRFLQDSALPGSAISLLETVANTVSLAADIPDFENTKKKIVLEEHVVKKVEETANVNIATPQGEEKDLLLHLEEKLHERVIGQADAITAISEAMRRVRSGMKTASRPVSFLFLGPTGVGKTETAKALSNLYYGGEKNMIRLDMSEYTDDTGVKRLLGSSPGEGNERGELTDKIHDHPSSLVLLDEFEKAHAEIHNLFLQVLDDGRLTDNKGVTVSFSNCIIIATSNAGSEFIREELEKGAQVDKQFHQKLLDHLQTKAIFKPELLNRFDDVITFKPLGDNEVGQVVKLLLQHLKDSLLEQDIKMVVEDSVVAKIVKEGFDKEFGARPLRRFIQDNLEDLIAQKKLNGELTRGQTATFSIDNSNNLQLTVS